MRPRRRILLVDDDATLRRVLAREIREFGYAVEAFADAAGVLESVQSVRAHAVVLDLRMPGLGGLELLRRIRDVDPDLPVLILTGHGGVPEAVEAMRGGAYDFLTKPVSLDALEAVLRRASERRELVDENRRLRRLAEAESERAGILGEDPRTEALRALIGRIAPGDASVLISGEHGTGKELVARAVHEQSSRSDRPFVVVHMGAIPEALIESELFGHERGAFTGAARQRVGLFEAADGGTIFLDEIGELPLSMQPVLLRVLQSGELRPVGGLRTREVDVRVVAATNRDLPTEVAAGRFREDLYYRLATIPIEVPPLRERPGDIAVLARVFLADEVRRGARVGGFSPEALQALVRHDWPGNVRELQNAVARFGTLVLGQEVTAEDVARHVTGRRRAGAAESLPTLDLGELELLAIRAAMRKHGGNKRAAAAELGVALKTLYNKLARLPGIEP